MSTRQNDRARPVGQRAALRRLTVTTAGTAIGLTAVLFVQTGVQSAAPGDLQGALVAAISSVFPGGGLRPPPQPTASPSGSGVVTTGGS